jgi:integrase
MASAGIRKRTSTRTGRVSYEVWWRLDDGSQSSKTFTRKAAAIEFKNAFLAKGGANVARHRRIRFKEWADRWWATWSSHPRRSPNSRQSTDIRVRRYVRPGFDDRLVHTITVAEVQQWQNALEARVGFDTVMACRSILYRILQAAEDEGITVNPVRKVPAPRRPVDPEAVFGRVKRRTLTPEEAGHLLACFPRHWWDHVISLLGTGLRISELAGLQCFRAEVDVADGVAGGRLEVVETRYEAGKFGKGIKDRPKSDASVREVPLPWQVAEAIARQMPAGGDAAALVFAGPGGGFRRSRGERTPLSPGNFRRVYQRAVRKAATTAEATLAHLNLRGPHDLRHTYATWLEEAGIPTRVIDELMGHAGGRRGVGEGSAIGRAYRHTTPEMRARVVAVLEARLAITLEVATRLLGNQAAGEPTGAARWREWRAEAVRTANGGEGFEP